jgi:hypothetical protein
MVSWDEGLEGIVRRVGRQKGFCGNFETDWDGWELTDEIIVMNRIKSVSLRLECGWQRSRW